MNIYCEIDTEGNKELRFVRIDSGKYIISNRTYKVNSHKRVIQVNQLFRTYKTFAMIGNFGLSVLISIKEKNNA